VPYFSSRVLVRDQVLTYEIVRLGSISLRTTVLLADACFQRVKTAGIRYQTPVIVSHSPVPQLF